MEVHIICGSIQRSSTPLRVDGNIQRFLLFELKIVRLAIRKKKKNYQENYLLLSQHGFYSLSQSSFYFILIHSFDFSVLFLFPFLFAPQLRPRADVIIHIKENSSTIFVRFLHPIFLLFIFSLLFPLSSFHLATQKGAESAAHFSSFSNLPFTVYQYGGHHQFTSLPPQRFH